LVVEQVRVDRRIEGGIVPFKREGARLLLEGIEQTAPISALCGAPHNADYAELSVGPCAISTEFSSGKKCYVADTSREQCYFFLRRGRAGLRPLGKGLGVVAPLGG
jgi:hypothetical protein